MSNSLSGSNSPAFLALPEFTQGYIEAIFTSGGDIDDDPIVNKGFQDLSPEALAVIVGVCESFTTKNRDQINDACFAGRAKKYSMRNAGRDFWLTVANKGEAYVNSLGDDGEELNSIALSWVSPGFYLREDGMVHTATTEKPALSL